MKSLIFGALALLTAETAQGEARTEPAPLPPGWLIYPLPEGAELRFVPLLALTVLELTVIHDLADRRIGGGGDLDEVETGFAGECDGVVDGGDPPVRSILVDQQAFDAPASRTRADLTL